MNKAFMATNESLVPFNGPISILSIVRNQMLSIVLIKLRNQNHPAG